ncbi:hypothetical protein [Nonomuraea sp. NPDC050310]|uniref:hypothetical protein n=1 Tax=Nonomuraea sp. NPDC050310 TaxID=3154935 RepID=UPI0033EE6462
MITHAHAHRLTAHKTVSTTLAGLGDHELTELVAHAPGLGSGLGGRSALLDVAGIPVFVKRVPLSDLERRPDLVGSTANLFELPLLCHYGVGTVGAPSFGAWRELAAHAMTTGWVLTAEHEGFPLMHHWRVLPDSAPLPDELADVDRAVAYWGGSARVRHRIEALRQSSASLTLFLEHLPLNLHQWLSGHDRIADACTEVERELAAGVAFMNSRGLLHFDAHFENILTDGRRLYFGDFGLALSAGFELAPDEAAFFDRNQHYDRGYTASCLVSWLVTALYGLRPDDRDGRFALVHAFAEGERPTGIPAEAAEVILRNAPAAAAVAGFVREFRRECPRF